MSMNETVREAVADAGLKLTRLDGKTRDGFRLVYANARLGGVSAQKAERVLRSTLDLSRFEVKGKSVRITAVL